MSDGVTLSKELLTETNSSYQNHVNRNLSFINTTTPPCCDLSAVHVPHVLTLNFLVIFCLVVQSCIMLPIVMGNTLIVISVSKFHFLRKPCNILIASLALSDLLVGLVAIPYDFAFYLSYSLKRMRYPCLFRHFIWITCLGSSMSNLLLISVERCMALDFPLRHQIYMTNKKSVLAAVITWTSVVVPVCTILIGNDTWTPKYGCMFHHIFKKAFTRFISFWIISQLTLSAVLFIRIIVIAKTRVNRALSSNRTAQKEKNEQSRSKLLALIYGLFVLFWVPYMLYGFSTSMSKQDSEDKYGKLMVLIGTCNSCVNFFVYGYKKPRFRLAFKKIIRFYNFNLGQGQTNRSSSSSQGHGSDNTARSSGCSHKQTEVDVYYDCPVCGREHDRTQLQSLQVDALTEESMELLMERQHFIPNAFD